MEDRRRKRVRGTGLARVVILAAAGLLLAGSPGWAANPCAECHEEQVTPMLKTVHRGVVAEGAAFCAACHGNPAAHLESGEAKDIRGPAKLAKWTVERQSEACLSCHGRDFPGWKEAPHAGRVSCWSCHDDQALHFKPKGTDLPKAARHATWQLCTSCHQSVKAEFRQEYRHPVQAGLVDCTDCHDVHGTSATRTVEVANTTCVKCHEQQAGPYVFKHPAMDEGCTSCHRPHGSWNRDLLKSVGNGICLTCHVQSSFPGVGQIDHEFRLSGGARCWDCHSDVHGSNTTPDFNPRGRR